MTGRAALVAVGLLALLGVVPVAGAADDRLAPLMAALGVAPVRAAPAPPFTLSRLDGAPLSLADLRGRVVMLYFWATW